MQVEKQTTWRKLPLCRGRLIGTRDALVLVWWPKGSPVAVYCQCQQVLGEGHGRARLEFHPHLGRSRLRDCVAMAVKLRPFYPSPVYQLGTPMPR